MASKRLDQLGREVIDLRAAYEKASKAAGKAEDRKKEKERELYDVMQDTGHKSSGVLELGPGYGEVTFTRRETLRSRVIDREVLIAALEAEHLDEGYTFTDLRKAALNELMKERLENGQDLPDGMDYSETKFIQVKAKKKK